MSEAYLPVQFPFMTIDWRDDAVVLLDQRRLPGEEVYLTCRTVEAVAEAIETLAIRGAPAIGVAGAMGVALAAVSSRAATPAALAQEVAAAAERLAATRPTAVNLFWAIARMRRSLADGAGLSIAEIKGRLRDEAIAILREDIVANRALGKNGAALIAEGDTVLTHCNAGALATGGYGTALGVLYAAWETGKRFSVIADETRPVLQGARLTAWELQKIGIPTTLICDNMAGSLMAQGLIDKVIVGADRIAGNGDVANKIGTYSVAVLARYHGIPLYVAAPQSTIDPQTASGASIPIEERAPHEVSHLQGICMAPDGISIKNPAFDVTPATLVSAIITEEAVFYPPYSFNW